MIGRIRGEVIDRVDHVHHALVTVEVAGVGYEVLTPRGDVSESHTAVDLFTDLVVREDSMTLYGFSSSARRSLFRMLQTVTGVGPKVALTMMASTRTDELATAIVDGDVAFLERIPGIGKKVASRITLELREKMDLPKVGGGSDVKRTVISALINLGYSEKEANSAVAELGSESGAGDVEGALKEALARLNRSTR